MGFRINTNTTSLSAQRALGKVTQQSEKVSNQLASGSGIRSNQQANRNANDGISMIQVAEGGLNETGNILIRLRELAVQSASDTVGETERGYTDLEYQQLKQELGRISETTTFNGKSLLNGDGGELDFQIGANNDDFKDRIQYDTSKINSGLDNLGLGSEGVSNKEDAQASLEVVDTAINTVSGQRAELGALQNRLQATSTNLETSVENMSAANSRIRDVDFASATAENAKNNILKQAGTSVLAQANSQGQSALRLIG
jgi:flagellin